MLAWMPVTSPHHPPPYEPFRTYRLALSAVRDLNSNEEEEADDVELLLPPACSRLAQMCDDVLCSCRMSGRRVTIPCPLGRKSLPTMLSRTELLPTDCPPTT